MNIVSTFAALAHYWHIMVANQKRKYSGQPYTVHTTEVAEIYASFFPKDDIGIAAAHGHDILEDTPATVPQMAEHAFLLMGDKFNTGEFSQVNKVIRELTDVFISEDYPEMNREQRKTAERNRLMFVRATAQNVKLADLISNTRDIARNDPGFAVTYLKEKEAVLGMLNKADIRIKTEAYKVLREAKEKIQLWVDAETKPL
jgi:(p)ppGpp synthase/HD superfamily hydrolase